MIDRLVIFAWEHFIPTHWVYARGWRYQVANYAWSKSWGKNWGDADRSCCRGLEVDR